MISGGPEVFVYSGAAEGKFCEVGFADNFYISFTRVGETLGVT
jgi:hypothetical protein